MIIISTVFVLIFGFLFKTSYAGIKPLIVGGDYASIELYPHSASIHIDLTSKTNNSLHGLIHCGASILNQDVLITAGHCVREREKYYTEKITATVGLINITEAPKTNTHLVYSFIRHEAYGYKQEVKNDIALLKLKNPLKFGETVKRVAIMKSPPYDGPASIAGWGQVDYKGTKTYILKHLRGLKVWSTEECIDHFDMKKRSYKIIAKDSFCAAYSHYKSTLEHIYHGDSGSALVVQDYIQIGIAQMGLTLAARKERKRELVQIYTDVGFYYDWIVKNVKELYRGNSSAIVVLGEGDDNKYV